MDVVGLQKEEVWGGGGGGSREANERGVGTDGSSCGDMGMGNCRASPKVLPVMPSRISRFPRSLS